MSKKLLGLLLVIAVLGVLALCTTVAIEFLGARGPRSLPSKLVLEADFDREIEEYLPDQTVSQAFGGEEPTTRDIVDGIDRAAKDERVAGLVARLGAVPMGMAQIQEFRDAILRFRKSGKPAVAWSETFGEFGAGNGAYYLATAFDTIYLQPSGDIGLTGLMYESPFFKHMFEKLDVVPRMDHRYEYKNAMNVYTESQYTAPHREAMQKLMDSQFSQIVRGIAAARKLTEAEVRARFDQGPFLGQQAVDAKLVDGLLYRDEVFDKLKAKAGGTPKFLYVEKYLERAGRPHASGDKIALIYGVGAVSRSYVASDTIWRETQLARKAGKPVVVSMGNLAGSGGYFVAMGADKIVAQPGTITASIGVLGGKLYTKGFWTRLGIDWDEIHTSANGTMFDASTDYTPQEWAKFQQWLDRVYVDFTSKVAAGRRLPKDKVLAIAKGRIWSGEDAKDLGLVDALGGMDVALALVKEAAKIPASKDVDLTLYPRKRSFFETLLHQRPDSSESDSWSTTAVDAMRELRPVLALLRQAGLAGGEPGVLSMPPMRPAR